MLPGFGRTQCFFFFSLICQVGVYYVNKNAKVTSVALLLKSLICYYNVYLAVVIRHAIQFDGAQDREVFVILLFPLQLQEQLSTRTTTPCYTISEHIPSSNIYILYVLYFYNTSLQAPEYTVTSLHM